MNINTVKLDMNTYLQRNKLIYMSINQKVSKNDARHLANLFLKRLDTRIVRPSLKAFLVAFAYVILPRIFNTIIISIRKKEYSQLPSRILKLIMRAFHPRKFPVFCAKLVAGINILEPLIYRTLKKIQITHPVYNLFISTLLSSFISAISTFPLYQNYIIKKDRFFSLDLTLLVLTRACDTVLSSGLSRVLPFALTKYGDASLFIASCSLIMYSWFYRPSALPPAYCKWITSAANMDSEILQTLREIKEGKLAYGKYDPEHDTLAPYCRRYKQDPKLGNLQLNQPLDCYVVHCFKTKSCEINALWRFARGFSFAIKIYGPLNAFMLLIPNKNIKMRLRIIKAIKSSMRSSCFLGAFIGFYWYAVCLTRTRLLPKLFPKVPKTRWDNSIVALSGLVACGFSSLIETAQRRKELALFVAPRALGTLIPTESPKNLRIERIVFSISMALLVAYSKSDSQKVRGIFGKGIQQIFNVHEYA